MHAIGILVLVVLFHADVTFSWMPVIKDTETLKSTLEVKPNVTTTTPPPAIPCKTAKNITGVCVQRENCDFGRGAVDFTLYRTKWYKKPCKVEEVCCPYQFLMVKSQPDKQDANSDDYFDLDDDEY